MSKIGKLWTDSVAYVALILGAGASMAGNIVDTYRTRGQATDGLDIFLAAFFPGLVVLMVEVFVSSRWRGLSWPLQIVRWLGCVSISAVAMRVSWVHLNELMSSRGQQADVATLGPLAIDFLAIMATALILAGRGQAPRLLDRTMAMSEAEVDTVMSKWVNPVQVRTAMADALDTLATGEREPAMITLDNRDATSMPESERSLFERLEEQFAGQVPTLPVPVSPAPSTVADVRTATNSGLARQGRLLLQDSREAHSFAAMGRQHGLKAGEISEFLAGYYGVSPRTIRRCGWWVPTMAGTLDSDAS